MDKDFAGFDFTLTSTKTYQDYPCAHRQWRHDGHCKLVHGYSRNFSFWFVAKELDKHGFVMDFSALKPLKAYLDDTFDHTLLINADDPEIPFFEEMEKRGAYKLRILPNVGMEGTARHLWEVADRMVSEASQGRVRCFRVESRENAKNSALYSPCGR